MCLYGCNVSSIACRRAVWIALLGLLSPSFAVLLRGVEYRNVLANSSLARFAIVSPRSLTRCWWKGGVRVRLYVG